MWLRRAVYAARNKQPTARTATGCRRVKTYHGKKKGQQVMLAFIISGAQERTRTSTELPAST